MNNNILEIGLDEAFQNELEKASESLLKLVEEKPMNQYGEKHDIFGFFVKFTVNQMDMLRSPKKMCKSNSAVQSYWSLVKRSFITNIITLTTQLLEISNDANDLNKKDEALQAIDHILHCEIVNHNNYVEILTWVKNKISHDRGTFLIRSIKNTLKAKKVSDKNRQMHIGFFQALNSLRNNYAHFSQELSPKETNEIIRFLPTLVKSGQNKKFVDTYPSDILEIVSKYYVFLDVIEETRCQI